MRRILLSNSIFEYAGAPLRFTLSVITGITLRKLVCFAKLLKLNGIEGTRYGTDQRALWVRLALEDSGS